MLGKVWTKVPTGCAPRILPTSFALSATRIEPRRSSATRDGASSIRTSR